MTIEAINPHPIGPVGHKYHEVADNFAGASECNFLAMHLFEIQVSYAC